MSALMQLYLLAGVAGSYDYYDYYSYDQGSNREEEQILPEQLIVLTENLSFQVEHQRLHQSLGC